MEKYKMQHHIELLLSRIESLTRELSSELKTLQTLQGLCNHDWSYDGHGHNNSYYVCSKCGLEKEE